MANATMCTYPQSEHALPHWKCVLRCCAECPCINIPDQKRTTKHDETTSSIRFHIYHIIGRCTTHGRILLKDKNMCYMCKQESLPDTSTKIYTRKELVTMETKISNFHSIFYIPAIQKLDFSYTTCAHTWYKSLWWNATHSLQTKWIISRFFVAVALCHL